jgi:hypothetical protein
VTAAAPVRAEPRADELRSPAESYCLLRSLEELGAVLLRALAGGFGLDAYLVAAGMRQIVQDELHPDPFRLDAIASFLGGRAGAAVRRLGQLVQLVREPFLARAVRRCDRELAAIVDALAPLGPVPDEALRRAAALVEAIERLPAPVRSAVLRLPACYHDFDQRPEDAERLARDFADRYPDRRARLVVVGVRTSGSYLAPVQAAALRREGFEHVEVVTVRPGRRLLREEWKPVRAADRVLVVDDPPGTGGSLARVIRDLRVAPARVVLLLQLFDGQELPPALAGYAAVCLPWREWAVHAFLPGDRLEAGRGHARARDRGEQRIVSGAGLGYFGSAAPEIARALPGFVPEVDRSDGILRREWLPDERRADDPRVVGEYVAARAAALPVREDFSLRMTGEFPAWEVASNLLSRVFGRAGPMVKLLGVDAAARRLLHVERPSLVDGWTGRGQWFVPGLKVGFHERSYWHLGLGCFDPAHDLAVAAAGRDDAFAAALVRAYEERSGIAVDPERILLYELAHLWCRERLHPDDSLEVRRALAAAVRRYFRRRFLGDASVAADGPVCALDLDGVLETEHLGFPSTTRSGALALRALLRHGYRPVIASGRSAEEVADRCAGYGLDGGVAEYGGALVRGGAVRSLLTAEQGRELEHVREELDSLDGVRLDPRYTYSIRAYGLDERMLVDRRAVRAVPGEGQTDFVPVGIDKATGLEALLGGRGPAFAVGDTEADLPMLSLARRAAAPRHAGSALRRLRVGRPYQAGLAEAVGALLGHAPGACPDCAVELDGRAELLLSILSAQERGPIGIVRTALGLWRSA